MNDIFSSKENSKVIFRTARTARRRRDQTPEGFLARGTRIISKAGEWNDLDERGEVHTGTMAEGFIHDIWPDQETCYGVAFQKSGVTICLTKDEVASGEYEVHEAFLDNEVIGFDSEHDGNLSLVLWNAEHGLAENIGETLEEFGIANLHQHELDRVGVTEASWNAAVAAAVAEINSRLQATGASDATFDQADKATIMAALQFYLENGQGDPYNRTCHIHELATAHQQQISLDDEGITSLMQRVNLAKMFN